jgi:hypothetical protein
VQAARQHNETTVGYRIASEAKDAGKAYSVYVNLFLKNLRQSTYAQSSQVLPSLFLIFFPQLDCRGFFFATL